MWATLRLLKITLISIFFLCLIFSSLRFAGFSQKFIPWDHPIKNLKKIIVRPLFAHENLESLGHQKVNVLLHLNCLFRNGGWKVYPESNLKSGDSESYKRDKKNFYLKNILKKYKKNFFSLRLLSFNKLELRNLVNLLEETKATQRVIISSPLAQILRELRKIAPDLLFVAHPKEISKLSLMTSLFIETTVNLKADIFLISADKLIFFNKEILELQRRHKTILISYKKNELTSLSRKIDNMDFDGIFIKSSFVQ